MIHQRHRTPRLARCTATGLVTPVQGEHALCPGARWASTRPSLDRRIGPAYHGNVHGLNVIARATPDDQTELEVVEIFHTLQGEGPFAGEPAVFVRLAGCNLQCKFCDTDFETTNMRLNAMEVARHIERQRNSNGPCGLVVLTGGEPMRQNIGPLINALNAGGWRVQIETAGTLWRAPWMQLFQARNANGHVPSTGNTIVCSPKTARIAPGIHPYIHALKYIVQHGQMCVKDGMPVLNTQVKGPLEMRPIRPKQLLGPPIHHSQIYMQPCDTGDGVAHRVDNAKNLVTATQICLRRGFRLSIQLHKLAKVP